ncbi:class I SAM-dependent methyltransferase [Desulfocurvus sp. DL9XJH121]
MPHHPDIETINHIPDPDALWAGAYKIPWNDPDFSRRMLAVHLDQNTPLASRPTAAIRAQVDWLDQAALRGRGARVLDLCCGPGLYAPWFAELGHGYLGLDFGPASVEHARRNHAGPGREFLLGDVLRADLGGPHDLALMLYGEFNVFPPRDAAGLLQRIRAALAPGGTVALEVHTYGAVARSGRGESWQACAGGLFSDEPYLCLVRNHWFSARRTSVQRYVILQSGGTRPRAYCSTMRAYSRRELAELLLDAGFERAEFHAAWPGSGRDLILVTARA